MVKNKPNINKTLMLMLMISTVFMDTGDATLLLRTGRQTGLESEPT